MSCYRPLYAYRSYDLKTDAGKSVIRFNRKDAGNLSSPVILPCGQCIGCRIERSKQWALRCVHEASLYKNNCFITLTFNDKNLNELGSLVKSDFQKFMKRLRRSDCGYEGIDKDGCIYPSDWDSTDSVKYPIRFFHCGEYGSKLSRPHHHACLFNYDFSDKVLWSVRDGVKLYRSPSLEKLWPYGYSTIGDVTFQSAAYVARYITKKVNGDKAKAHYSRINKITGEMLSIEPEYITMSRRPGIAKNWFKGNVNDVFPKDFTTHKGKKFRPPAYYDKLYDEISPENMQIIKKKRLTNAGLRADNNTPIRLRTREECQNRKMLLLKRDMEI